MMSSKRCDQLSLIVIAIVCPSQELKLIFFNSFHLIRFSAYLSEKYSYQLLCDAKVMNAKAYFKNVFIKKFN